MEKAMFSSEVSAYLRDESGMTGTAEAVCFPENVPELQAVLRQLKGKNITVQGARTGLCGGAVPSESVIINMTRMKEVTGFSYDKEKEEGTITVAAGVTLGEIKQWLKKKRMDVSGLSEEDLTAWEAYQKSGYTLWFLPNPTEQEATLGGIAATGAVGSHIGSGGEMKENILDAEVILRDGSFAETGNGSSFLGTESEAGIFVKLKLRLVKMPEFRWGLFSFHHSYETMNTFFEEYTDFLEDTNVAIGAADWFSGSSGNLSENKTVQIPEKAECVLWTELWGEEEDEIFDALEAALELLEEEDDFNELALAATNETEFVRLEIFRHEVTEAVSLIHDRRTALLDWESEENPLSAVRAVTDLLRNTENVLLGHLPRGMATLYILDEAEKMEEAVIRLLLGKKCNYSTEHGCGKRKKEYKAKF